MLFREWHAEVKCCPQQQQPCIKATFLSLQGKEMAYHGEVTEQLQKLTHSMDSCKDKWCSFISEMRSSFNLLNHYTSEQMVYLCHWIHKPQCTLTDVRDAYINAASIHSKHDEEEEDVEFVNEDQSVLSMDSTPASPGHSEEDREEDLDLMDFSSEDEDDGVLKCHDDAAEGALPGHTDDKMNCDEDSLENSGSPDQPLPSTDEVLVCKEETTEEEVEIFLRRALGQGSEGNWQKYTLLSIQGCWDMMSVRPLGSSLSFLREVPTLIIA
ncbi:hypothetical protein F7725_014714 [Dissostichus mawsoni]|uniref:Uncharacterized protein n=1 Tax=Dissostichus mawsoni TaxID=36200 RepID=A0A7J5YX76_DISMA|nr:hypothetical protein F7725_014714 [Dissostichus mawsoni]